MPTITITANQTLGHQQRKGVSPTLDNLRKGVIKGSEVGAVLPLKTKR